MTIDDLVQEAVGTHCVPKHFSESFGTSVRALSPEIKTSLRRHIAHIKWLKSGGRLGERYTGPLSKDLFSGGDLTAAEIQKYETLPNWQGNDILNARYTRFDRAVFKHNSFSYFFADWCSLRDVKFENTEFSSSAKFVSSSLVGASFVGCTIAPSRCMNFTGCDLRNVNCGCFLSSPHIEFEDCLFSTDALAWLVLRSDFNWLFTEKGNKIY